MHFRTTLPDSLCFETFGGKRMYYIFLSPDAPLDEAKRQFAEKYSEHRIEWEVIENSDWRFIRRYCADYNLYGL